MNWPPSQLTTCDTGSLLHPEHDIQWRINDFWLKSAKMLFIDVCNYLPRRLPQIQEQTSLSLC
jgi:hypothetical protein